VSPVVTQIAFGAAAPGAIAGAALCLATLGEEGAAQRTKAVIGAAAIAGAYVAAETLLLGVPAFPPIDVTHWPFFFAIGLVAVAAIEAIFSRPRALAIGTRALASAAAAWLLLRPVLDTGIERDHAAMAALLFAAWIGLGAFALRTPATGTFIGLAAFAGAAAGALALSGSALLGQLCGAVASGAGGLVVASLVRQGRGTAAAAGAAPVAAVLVSCLLLSGRVYADLPEEAALFLAAGGIGAGVLSWLLASFRRAAALASTGILAAGSIAGAAIAFARSSANG